MKGDWLLYIAPVLPAVTPIYNEWKKWRKNKKLGINLVLTVGAVFVAWGVIYVGTEQTRESASQQSAKLSLLQKQSRDLIIQTQDLQDDVNSIRATQYYLPAHRTRVATEDDGTTLTLHVTDSATATVTPAEGSRSFDALAK
jgi:hypothetical protein